MRSILQLGAPSRMALVALLSLGLCVGCGDGGEAKGGASSADSGSTKAAPPSGDASAAPSTPPSDQPIDPATSGGAGGRVVWQGAAPERPFQRMIGDAWCMGAHENEGFLYDAWVVGEGGALANVFVQVVEGLDGYEIPEPGEPVVLDQVACLFDPKMLGVQIKQTLVITNSDPTLHNAHGKAKRNRSFNIAIPAADVSSPDAPRLTKEVSLKKAEIIEVTCDVHAWMRSWVGVVEHPFFAVSDAAGAWSIDGLPPGDYVLEFWHEKAGTKRQNVTVAANAMSAATTVSFSE